MEDLAELEKQYSEAKEHMDWQKMAAIMLKVYPEHDQPSQETKRKSNIKTL